MKKLVKWLSIIIGSIIGLLLIAFIVLNVVSNSRLNKTYDVTVEEVLIPTDAESITYGEHVAIIRGCTDCHGSDLGGKAFIDDPPLGTIYATNITRGEGGIPKYNDKDWVRAIRHGVDPDGKPLLMMPSQEFYYLSDTDLGALIAYLNSITNVNNETPEGKIGPLGRFLFLAGQLQLLPAELIDHDAIRPEAPAQGVTVDYGQYIAVGCIGCHGANYSGGKIPGSPPDWPPAANLTPSGSLSSWTEANFISAIRTGIKPNEEKFTEFMPYKAFGQAKDDELKALWMFLESLPESETGSR